MIDDMIRGLDDFQAFRVLTTFARGRLCAGTWRRRSGRRNSIGPCKRPILRGADFASRPAASLDRGRRSLRLNWSVPVSRSTPRDSHPRKEVAHD